MRGYTSRELPRAPASRIATILRRRLTSITPRNEVAAPFFVIFVFFITLCARVSERGSFFCTVVESCVFFFSSFARGGGIDRRRRMRRGTREIGAEIYLHETNCARTFCCPGGLREIAIRKLRKRVDRSFLIFSSELQMNSQVVLSRWG